MNISKQINQKADILKALGHPTRLCIVRGLLQEDSNVNCMADCMKLPQPTISQHLTILKNAGIIAGTRQGKEIRYTIINPEAEAVVRLICRE